MCLEIHVHKCTYCVQEQDTLDSVAKELGADWLQIWGANVHLRYVCVPSLALALESRGRFAACMAVQHPLLFVMELPRQLTLQTNSIVFPSAPFGLKDQQLILLGPLLTPRPGDTVSSLSARYGSSAKTIHLLNPLGILSPMPIARPNTLGTHSSSCH